MKDWLTVRRGEAPLILSLPHTGAEIPAEYENNFVSPWLARRDMDWWVDQLYDFAAAEFDATIVRTSISRSIIDVNRDPSGVSLYPGQATTELCPTTTFDGDPLYKENYAPDSVDVAERRTRYFDPYHSAVAHELIRLRALHPAVVLYDCHSIRSVVPRLFKGVLPEFNVGTNDGKSCAAGLSQRIIEICAESGRSHVLDGRFKGGWITRHHALPSKGVHAVQMEIACRAYMREPPEALSDRNWPARFDAAHAAPLRGALRRVLSACRDFAASAASGLLPDQP
jgi:N-formylglutamate deformylase